MSTVSLNNSFPAPFISMFYVPFFPVAFAAWCAYGGHLIYRVGKPHAKHLTLLNEMIQQQRNSKVMCSPCNWDENEAIKARLEERSREMEELGFQRSGDYGLYPSNLAQRASGWEHPPIADPLAPPSVAFTPFYALICTRTFVHPIHGCIGKISFNVKRNTKNRKIVRIAISTSLVSLTEDATEVTRYETAYRNSREKEHLQRKLARHPRYLKTLMIEASPDQMLEFHLKRRAQIARVANIKWKSQLSAMDCIKCDEFFYTYLREVFERSNPFSLAWRIARFKKEKAKLEWLGYLKGRLD